MALHPRANFGGLVLKIYKDIKREPRFFSKPSTDTYINVQNISLYTC